jgi:hypothetical protein
MPQLFGSNFGPKQSPKTPNRIGENSPHSRSLKAALNTSVYEDLHAGSPRIPHFLQPDGTVTSKSEDLCRLSRSEYLGGLSLLHSRDDNPRKVAI